MPFAVSQWPYFPDPRKPDFAAFGWNHSQVPPFSWIMHTTGATGIFRFFNLGVVNRNSFDSLGFSIYGPIIPPPFALVWDLSIFGFEDPQPGPPVHTIHFHFHIFKETSSQMEGDLELLFPVAIAEQGPIPVVQHDTTFGTIPNPMFLTPAIWSAE